MKKLMLFAVILHFIIAGWHGVSHQMVPVPLSSAQTAFVAIVIIGLPLLGAAMSYSRLALAGAVLVLVSMLGALAFGVINHFLLVSADNVWCLPQVPWRISFFSSAVLVAASEAFGVISAALVCRQLSRAQQPPARRAGDQD